MSFACEGCNLSMFPALIGRMFGPLLGGKLFPVMFLGIIICSETLVFVKTYIVKGNGGTIFYIGGICSLINVGLLCAFKEPTNQLGNVISALPEEGQKLIQGREASVSQTSRGKDIN